MATDIPYFQGAGAPDQRVAAPRNAALASPSLYALLILQALGALFFIVDLWSEVLQLRTTPIPYEYQEIIQILASLSLAIGLVTTISYFRRSQHNLRDMRRQIDVASGNFRDHLDHCFTSWSLSPSEREVAICAMKGFSNGEVADLRGTSAATVKTQMNAIYRKSGFSTRAQLISFLVEELFAGVTVDRRQSQL
ncbi:MAG TPA: helix-turn-helix transcriptional regulator [Albidovulum sp.]|uniref:helix-turn-helix transcriptional regulator n=1 Tax=Albidovulum sp. TaxID=1872424 RepID=UPI002BBCCEAD|nr:helix-turn-helix transcriptional regulator [Albidovulum sp.]